MWSTIKKSWQSQIFGGYNWWSIKLGSTYRIPENKTKLLYDHNKKNKKYIPESEYLKVYNALFMSPLTYGISCWGGVSSYKLQEIFSIQKRCIRLLFGKLSSYDEADYFQTCARARTYDENITPKNYCLEHTKPLFNEWKILSLNYLHKYYCFMEAFKILKYHYPTALYEIFTITPRSDKHLLIPPKINLECSKQNFVFTASLIWNKFIGIILNLKNVPPTRSGIVIPGSERNSDLSASLCVTKSKLKSHLLLIQGEGDATNWTFWVKLILNISNWLLMFHIFYYCNLLLYM